MRSSYSEKDVTILLKDLTGQIEPMCTADREREIQSGRHYSEMLPLESPPSVEYMQTYNECLELYAQENADAVTVLADKLYCRVGQSVVLVSLARAGVPVGILLKRYFKYKWNISVPHYAISIVRGKGIDKNAMNYILSQHNAKNIVIVDGWVGKGAIFNQLKEALKDYEGVSPEIAVLADPAGVTSLCGTHKDMLVPCSCLNSVVSGLMSRSILRDDLIGENDYHGSVYMSELEAYDISYDFISVIEKRFSKDVPFSITENTNAVSEKSEGRLEAERIAKEYGVNDINFVKPSVGETIRVLLRRVPSKVLINQKCRGNAELKPILRLAQEKNVPVEYIDMKCYVACGIIQDLSDA